MSGIPRKRRKLDNDVLSSSEDNLIELIDEKSFIPRISKADINFIDPNIPNRVPDIIDLSCDPIPKRMWENDNDIIDLCSSESEADPQIEIPSLTTIDDHLMGNRKELSNISKVAIIPDFPQSVEYGLIETNAADNSFLETAISCSSPPSSEIDTQIVNIREILKYNVQLTPLASQNVPTTISAHTDEETIFILDDEDSGLASSEVDRTPTLPTKSIVDGLSANEINNCLRQFQFSNLLGLDDNKKKALVQNIQNKFKLSNECVQAATLGLFQIVKIGDHKLSISLDMCYQCKVKGLVQLQWLPENKENEHLDFNEAIDVYISNIKTDRVSLYISALKTHLVRVSNAITKKDGEKWYNLVFKLNGRYKPFLKSESWVLQFDILNKHFVN